MEKWTTKSAEKSVHAFNQLTPELKHMFIEYCNTHFPPCIFNRNLECRKQALANVKKAKDALDGITQKFPPLVNFSGIAAIPENIRNTAVILTAGGEGERLRKSLMEKGASAEQLKNFTKATFPLPDFIDGFGALQANLCLLAHLSKRNGFDIPVVVTTGPEGSATADIIPEILEKHDMFGLKNVKIIKQEERIHFTADDKMAYKITDNRAYPVTHPDETGGPLMSLKREKESGKSVLSWIENLGCSGMLVLQGTGLYVPSVLFSMASALESYDCIGTGILRESFDQNDQFGTYVSIVNKTSEKVMIIEQGIRNSTTMAIKDQTGQYFLPYNTGLYAFKNEILKNSDLPDYATPPKEVLPGLPRSPKIGYAATDIFSLSEKTAVLNVPADFFAVIKNASDLKALSDLGKRTGIYDICKNPV
jgi:hypothetical protein